MEAFSVHMERAENGKYNNRALHISQYVHPYFSLGHWGQGKRKKERKRLGIFKLQYKYLDYDLNVW